MKNLNSINNIKKHPILFYLVALYFFLSPLEDILNLGFGTILKFLAGIIIVFWLYDLVTLNRRIEFSIYTTIPLYLIFLSWISIFWSYQPATTFTRNIAYTLLPILYFIMINRNYSSRELYILDIFILLGGLTACFYALVNSFSGGGLGFRLVLTEGSDPNGFVGRILLSLFVSYKLLITKNKNAIMSIIVWICFLIILLTILLTGSRGAVVSLLVMSIVWLGIIGEKKRLKSLFSMIVLILSVVVILKLLPIEISERILGLDSYTRDFSGDSSRSAIWKTFFTKILPENPITGFGSGTAGFLTLKYNRRYQGMHNTYFNMWLEYGVLGIPVFGYFLFSIFKSLRKRRMILEIGFFLGTLVIIFFLDAYANKYLWNTLAYLVIAINQKIKKQSQLNYVYYNHSMIILKFKNGLI